MTDTNSYCSNRHFVRGAAIGALRAEKRRGKALRSSWQQGQVLGGAAAEHNNPKVPFRQVGSGEVANAFGGEVAFHRIAENLGEEKSFLPVTPEFSALAKPSHGCDVRRQVIGGILAGFGLGMGAGNGGAGVQGTEPLDGAFQEFTSIIDFDTKRRCGSRARPGSSRSVRPRRDR